ncbi:MAG TPA: hypothetical protein VMT21_12900 [Gemmatimonadales bacterium]|nr:hypothetical protein [Gemmatimonadales bacterium]
MSTLLVAGLAAAAGSFLAARRRRTTAPPGTRARHLGRKGVPVAVIARRTGLSQDAVRAALGLMAGGSLWRGSFFRSWPADGRGRQPSL